MKLQPWSRRKGWSPEGVAVQLQRAQCQRAKLQGRSGLIAMSVACFSESNSLPNVMLFYD